MNYLMPKNGVVSLHASANEGAEKGDVTVLFGLSGIFSINILEL